MSRILQALKQLQDRPAEAPGAPLPQAAPIAAVTPIPQAASAPLLEVPESGRSEPPVTPGRQVTERIAPRRKQRKARRAGIENNVKAEAAALETAADIERLLTALVPGVIECWTPHVGVESVVVPPTPDYHNASPQAHLVMQDFGPTVTLPLPQAMQPTAPPVELIIETADDSTAHSEVDLEFAAIQPRRAPVPEPAVIRPAERAETQAIECEVRQVVRGPRSESVTRPCAWETTVHADLDDARTAAPVRSLVERWQQERAARSSSCLLIASLAQPFAAAEVAMRAGALLARLSEEPVLLIDADPEGALSRRLAIIGKPGLAELLAPQDAHGDTIFPTATARLHVLPRGRGNWPPVSAAAGVQRLLGELAHEYAWLLVVAGDLHAPSLAPFARSCEGTYVVAPLGATDVTTAESRLALLQTAGARILGAIATE